MFIILGADDKEYGPVSTGQVRAWMLDGRANLQTKAKLPQEAAWRTLGDFPEFGGALPPPVAPETETPDVPPALTEQPASVPASLVLRLAAALIDGVLKTLCLLPVSLAVWQAVSAEILAGGQPSTAVVMEVIDGSIGRALPFLALLVLTQGALLAWRSQSVGKLLLGLTIVRHDDGTRADFRRSFFLRGALPVCIEQIPLLGFIFWVVDSAFIFSADRRCLHDLIAGTRVVRI